jgi:serine/threonine protein kinase
MLSRFRIDTLLPIRLTIDAFSSHEKGPAERADDLRRIFRRHRPPIAVGDYIGSGGFSDVYKAESDYDGIEEFALKVLRMDLLKPRPGADRNKEEMRIKDIKKRFTNESYVQWALSQHLSDRVSQSVVKVFDHGEFDRRRQCRFILMERMESTVRDYVNEPANHSNERDQLIYKTLLMTKIADIILNVHQEGIIHRDIKPENIFFYTSAGSRVGGKTASLSLRRRYDRDIRVKLGDFGTVRWVRTYSERFDGVIIGSQWYLSPEQFFDPEHVDTRTDIFSFGVVCYEILYGVHPKNVNADTGTKSLLQKLAWAKPQRRTPPKGFEELNEIIFACMQDLDSRYQTMVEVVRDMRHFSRKLD